MKKIIGMSGSLRKGSFNAGLLRAAVEWAPDSCIVDIVSIKGIPLYDNDVLEREGVPKVVAEIKDRIAASDALLLASPEYNNSIPGVFKNAIDWLSRPYDDIQRVFRNRAVGIIGASTGNFGTILSQTAWLPVFRFLGMRVFLVNQLYVSRAAALFDESGRLTDEKMQKRLQTYMNGFAEFIRQ